MIHAVQKNTEKKRGKKKDPLLILFPRRCPFCDSVLPGRGEPVCPSCRKNRKVSCLPFPGGFAPWPYAGVWRDAVKRFKYHGRPAYASFFADAILRAGESRIRAWAPECIIPVPVHASRRRERGYNQAEEIAVCLSRALGIPCEKKAVIRKRNTVPQNGLSPEERQRNLRGAFAVKDGIRLPGRVLLVDDIYTTGSTVRELEGLLKTRGAKEIHVVCVCVALSQDFW